MSCNEDAEILPPRLEWRLTVAASRMREVRCCSTRDERVACVADCMLTVELWKRREKGGGGEERGERREEGRSFFYL